MPNNNTPNVTLFLDGLTVFMFPRNHADIHAGLHTTAEGHSITISVKDKNGADVIKPISKSHAEIRDYEHLWLHVTGSGTASPPVPSTDFLNRIINFEDQRFFNRRLIPRADVLRPLLHLTRGVLTTHGQRPAEAFRVSPDANARLLDIFEDFVRHPTHVLEFAARVSAWFAQTTPLPLGRLPEKIKLEMYVGPQEQLWLESGSPDRAGGDKLIPIPLTPADGEHYEIHFNNLPTEQHHAHHASPLEAKLEAFRHNHFEHYYDAFEPPASGTDTKHVIIEAPLGGEIVPLGSWPDPPCIGGRTS